MTRCPCDPVTEWFPNTPAGLEALPRQPWSFPEVRETLLRGVGTAIPDWLAREPQDLGVMWLEMWAYISDVLAFYDERIANESYIRTAQRRPSLRRHVELLGYLPKPGLGGSVVVALEAEGRRPLTIPEKTGFRSEGFGTEPPQVYELASEAVIDPLRKQWEIGAIRKNALPDHPPTLATTPWISPTSPAGGTAFFVFETENFSLAKDRLVVFSGGLNPDPGVVTRVKELKPFEGRDARSYVEVEVEPPVYIPYGTKPGDVRVLTPTVSARRSAFTIQTIDNAKTSIYGRAVDNDPASTNGVLYLDSVYRQLSTDALFILSDSAGASVLFRADKVIEDTVLVIDQKEETRIPVTKVTLNDRIRSKYVGNPDQLTFHFAFGDAGRVTTVPSLDLTPTDMTNGVTLEGVVEAPVSADPLGTAKIFNGEFLLQDVNLLGAHVRGSIRFDETGRATFVVTDRLGKPLPTLKAPIQVYGNVVHAERGE